MTNSFNRRRFCLPIKAPLQSEKRLQRGFFLDNGRKGGYNKQQMLRNNCFSFLRRWADAAQIFVY